MRGIHGNRRIGRLLLQFAQVGAISVAAALAGCDQASPRSSSDPAVVAMAADVQIPVYFLLSDGGNCQTTNGGYVDLTARLVPKANVDLSANRNLYDYPPVNYTYATDAGFLMGVALTNMRIYTAQATSCYVPNDAFKATAVSPQHGWGGAVYHIYDVGKFELLNAKRINEAGGTDPQTGMATKFRSYRVTIGFHPSDSAAKFQSQPGLNGESCVILLKLNPSTLQWEHASDQCNYVRIMR